MAALRAQATSTTWPLSDGKFATSSTSPKAVQLPAGDLLIVCHRKPSAVRPTTCRSKGFSAMLTPLPDERHPNGHPSRVPASCPSSRGLPGPRPCRQRRLRAQQAQLACPPRRNHSSPPSSQVFSAACTIPRASGNGPVEAWLNTGRLAVGGAAGLYLFDFLPGGASLRQDDNLLIKYSLRSYRFPISGRDAPFLRIRLFMKHHFETMAPRLAHIADEHVGAVVPLVRPGWVSTGPQEVRSSPGPSRRRRGAGRA
jgi:hypothetical protein